MPHRRVQNSKPTKPADDEIDTMCPERCFRMTGSTARVTFIGPIRLTCQLPLHLLGCQLLEVARVEAGGVVDQHVDAPEALDGRLDRRLGVLRRW